LESFAYSATDVILIPEEAGRTVYEDRKGTSTNATRDGALGATGRQRRPPRLCSGQQPLRGECAVDRAGIGGEVAREVLTEP